MFQYIFPLLTILFVIYDHAWTERLRTKYPDFLEREKEDWLYDYGFPLFAGFLSGAGGASIYTNNGIRVLLAGFLASIISATSIYIYDNRGIISKLLGLNGN